MQVADSNKKIKDFVRELRKEPPIYNEMESQKDSKQSEKAIRRDIADGKNYRILKREIQPGEKIPLEMHFHRSEHWIIVKGTAKAIIAGEETYLHEGESMFFPKTTEHKIENPGKIALELIEVQIGDYFEDDDTILI